MTRSLVFDATAPGFAEQWQRLDWQLLQNSSVHRFSSEDEVKRTTTGLADLGYTLHLFDAGNWQHEGEMHTALMAELQFPDYYGRNLDALNDAFRDVAEYRYGSNADATGTVFALARFEPLTLGNPELARAFLNIFAVNARYGLLVGHPMLCLISAVSDYPAVGGTPVMLSLAPGVFTA